MPRNSYVKPDVRSETLAPDALCCTGSGGSDGTDPYPQQQTYKWLRCAPKPSCGMCCDD